jgi:hypothetical protein
MTALEGNGILPVGDGGVKRDHAGRFIRISLGWKLIMITSPWSRQATLNISHGPHDDAQSEFSPVYFHT